MVKKTNNRNYSFAAEEFSEEQLTSPAPSSFNQHEMMAEEGAEEGAYRETTLIQQQQQQTNNLNGTEAFGDDESTSLQQSPVVVFDVSREDHPREFREWRANMIKNSGFDVSSSQTHHARPPGHLPEEDNDSWTTRAPEPPQWSSSSNILHFDPPQDGLWASSTSTRYAQSSAGAPPSMRPEAECRVVGPFPRSESASVLRTVVIDGAPPQDDVTAITYDNHGYNHHHQGSSKRRRRDYYLLRRVLFGTLIVVMCIAAIAVGVVLATRPTSNDSSSSTNVVEEEPSTSLMPPPSSEEEGESACLLNLQVSCTVNNNNQASSCHEIQQRSSSCTSRPSTLVFKYNGGNCSNSLHNQGAFTCFDLLDNDSTSIAADDEAPYIVAQDVLTNHVYHQGYVALNAIFWASDFNNLISSAMNITIYSSSDMRAILQTLVFQSDCSSSLSLQDRFGAWTLTQFVNQEQGVVTTNNSDDGFVNVTYTYSVSNIGSQNVTLTSVTSTLDESALVVVTDDEMTLATGESQTFQHTIPIDATTRAVYTLNSTATADVTGEEETSCSAIDMYAFTAGPEPSIPQSSSSSPTQVVSPTSALLVPRPPISQSPTPSPTDVSETESPTASHNYCVVNLDVDCVLYSDGSNNNCTSIPPLTRTQCSERTGVMGFRHVGGSCMQSLNDQDDTTFQCIDMKHTNRAKFTERVLLVVFDVASGNMYENRSIAVGEEFYLDDFDNHSKGNTLNITTYDMSSSLSDTPSLHNMIQTVVLDKSCDSNAPLSLGDRFGSSLLWVYSSPHQGIVTSVVEATYTISVSFDAPATIESLFSVVVEGDILTNLTSRLIDTSRIYKPGETVQVKHKALVDLSVREPYSNVVSVTVQPTTTATSRDASNCSVGTFFEFQRNGFEHSLWFE